MSRRRGRMGAWLEGGALVLAGVAVTVFVVSAGAGLRFSEATAPTAAADVPAAAEAPAADGAAPVPEAGGPAPRVEVLNATSRGGLARDATERLRAAGFDVVYFGNAREARGLSLVLDRGGRGDAARRAAAALGIRDVRAEPNAAPDVDVTVVLGKDWPPAAPPPLPESRLSRAWRALRAAF